MRACGSRGAEREGAALLHRAVHLAPGVAAEGGVDLVAEALAGVGPRGEQPDHLHEVVGKVGRLGGYHRVEANKPSTMSCRAP